MGRIMGEGPRNVKKGRNNPRICVLLSWHRSTNKVPSPLDFLLLLTFTVESLTIETDAEPFSEEESTCVLSMFWFC